MSAEDPNDWKANLSPEQFAVCWQKGTEPPFSGELLTQKGTGEYRCVCCDSPLFHSNSKFDSGTGWPSFWQAVNKQAIRYVPDHSHGMVRTEVCCKHCGSHLGHVFEDGPPPSGKRYCINSLSLKFVAAKQQDA